MKKYKVLIFFLFISLGFVAFGCGNGTTITFNSNGGSKINNIKVKNGELVEEPIDPEKEGYGFLGWFNGEKNWDFSKDLVDKDIELTAKWIKMDDYFIMCGETIEQIHFLRGLERFIIGSYAMPSISIPNSYTNNGELIKITDVDLDALNKVGKITIDVNNKYFKASDTGLYSKDGKILYKLFDISDLDFILPTEIVSIKSSVLPYFEYINFKNNNNFKTQNGCLYSKDRKTFFGIINYDEFQKIRNKDESQFFNTILFGVEIIADYSFSHFQQTAFSDIIIPEGVKYIGRGVFDRNVVKVNITIPSSVEYIGEKAFGRIQPSSISVDEDNRYYKVFNGSLYTIDEKTLVLCSRDSKISDKVENIANFSVLGMKGIEIPESVKNISDYAFGTIFYGGVSVNKNNKHYKSVDGNLFTKDGKVLIRYNIANDQTAYTIPDGVVEIGDYAFRHCSDLVEITIPNSVTSIGSYAFEGCSNLTSITIPDSVTSIGAFAFSYCFLNEIDLFKVKSIGNYAFAGCYNLEKVIFSPELVSINTGLFLGCENLNDVIIPESIKNIEYCAFAYCKKITNINIPNGVTSIGDSAFYNCTSLTSITIPNTVTSIGKFAFDHCTRLESITIPEGVISIGDGTFFGCFVLTSITIPESVTSIGDYAFGACSSLTSITIPKDVISIGDYAFFNCYSLTSITIPESVISIGEFAFEGCKSLTSIIIPESVTSIGSYAFYKCQSLTSITIPKGVISIGEFAFLGCRNLTIYCEVQEQPEGWNVDWNSSDCPVVFGI